MGLLIGKLHQFWTELSARLVLVAGHYRFTFVFGLVLDCLSENVQSPQKKTVYFNVKLLGHTTLDSLHVIVFDKVMGFRVYTTLLAIQHTTRLR